MPLAASFLLRVQSPFPMFTVSEALKVWPLLVRICAVLVTEPPPMGVVVSKVMVSSVPPILRRDGITVLQKILCRYRIVAYLYIPYDFHTVRQAIRDLAALQEIGPQERMGYLYSDRPLDVACFGGRTGPSSQYAGFLTCVPCVSPIFYIVPASAFAVLLMIATPLGILSKSA